MKNQHRVAVSLIEILIVISLMMIVLAGGFAGYTQLSQQKKWDQDIEAVHTLLVTTLQKTASRDLDTYICSSFSGYEISTNQTSESISIFLVCPARQLVATYTLINAQIREVSHAQMMVKYPYGTLTQEFSLVLNNRHSQECQEIRITPQGVISLPSRYDC